MRNYLLSGESLKPNTSFNNGDFELRFQDDFNLVVYKSGKAYWASGSGSRVNIGKECELVMESGGNLKIGTHWEAGTDGNPGAFLKLEEYGVATIYTADGKNVLWTSGVLPSDGKVPADDKSLLSSCKKFELVFQKDNNLVLYERQYTGGTCSGRTALWATRTNGKADTLRMHSGGNLALYDSNNDEVWSTNTNEHGSYVKVEDGFVTVNSATNQRMWTSLGETWMSRLPDDTNVRLLFFILLLLI